MLIHLWETWVVSKAATSAAAEEDTDEYKKLDIFRNVDQNTYATENKINIDLDAIRLGVDDGDYRRFGDRELRKFEEALADFYTEITEPTEYNTIAIDIDQLPWVRDTKETNDYLKTVDASGQIVEITPTYNYYAGSYEENLPMLDERILPSLYETEICRILSERDFMLAPLGRWLVQEVVAMIYSLRLLMTGMTSELFYVKTKTLIPIQQILLFSHKQRSNKY